MVLYTGRKMKNLFLILSFFGSFAQASTLECNWLKTTGLADGFYKPAKIKLQMGEKQVQFLEDTYTTRSYDPCWVGGFSSCYFSFNYELDKPWEIRSLQQSDKSTTLAIESIWYWTAEMTWVFTTDLFSMQPGDTTLATVSGDDGDGVWFQEHQFSCTRL